MEKSIDVETTVGLTSENWSLSFENENMISETEKNKLNFLIYLYELLWLQMKALFLTLDEQDFPFHGFYPKSNANA